MYKNITHLEFDVTELCNLSCVYCYLSGRNNNKSLTPQVFDSFFEKFTCSKHHDSKNIDVSFWGGEPLLNFKIINYIVDRFQGKKHLFGKIQYNIISNGVLIDNKIADFCKKNNVNIQITIDGIKEYHDKHRKGKDGEETYTKTINGIKILCKKGVKYYTKCILSSGGQNILSIVDNLKKEGLDNVAFGIVTPTDCFSYQDITPDLINKFASDIYYNYINDFSCREDNFIYLNIERVVLHYFSITPAKSCGIGKHKIAIKNDGTLYLCHRFVNHPDFSIGSIDKGITDRYNFLYNNIININKSCKICEYKYSCGGPCVFDIINNDNIQYKNEYVCTFQKRIHFYVYKKITDLIYNNKLTNFHVFNKLNPEEILNAKCIESASIVDQESIFFLSENSHRIDLNDKGIVFLTDKFNKKYIIDSITMAIWDMIDGIRTVENIIDEIYSVCNAEYLKVKEDICKQLSILEAIGIVKRKKINNINPE
ncbi:MAG: SPASM domain-containing protein [Candidatus Electrothrix sp. LOE2]|nr:SPASM domain-containing protein [Candidatus Electrothrix sp. LOE2]